MEKFCVKGYLKRSGKRVLSILLCACMIGTMIPITAMAETEGTSMPSNGEVTCTCATLCTEDKVSSDCPLCGAEEADLSKCTGKVQSENNENQLNTGESEEAKNETELTITAWEWIDEEELINPETGILALPFANEETPAFFNDVVALLPTQIQATVVNAEDIEAKATSETITLGDWSCEEYPKEGAYSESYTFAAALPEGYVLSYEAKALNVLVELGGAQMLNITGVSYLSCDKNGTNWTEKTCNDAIEVTSEDTKWETSGNETWYVVQGDVKINRDLEVLGNVHLILTDKSSLDVQGSILVRKSQNSSLTIYGQSTPEVDEEGYLTNNTGKLKVSGKTKSFSGIGGGGVKGVTSNAGSITINGGVIYATGGSGGAGIGGGNHGNGGNITINGGMVTATGDSDGAGIGGGDGGAGGNIIINGGSINAKGGFRAAGIGGGTSGQGGTININGGDIKATGGEDSAGIGGSYGDTGTSAGDIFISGGTITATGRKGGAGIGSGYNNAEGGKIIISGGTVTAIGDKSKGIGFSNDSSDNTITISGGMVTAQGGTFAIYMYGGTFSTGENGTAVVFAEGNGIYGWDSIDKSKLNGTIFNKGTGIVYGNQILNSNLIIPDNATLNVQDGVTFTVSDGVNVINNGIIKVDGTMDQASAERVLKNPPSYRLAVTAGNVEGKELDSKNAGENIYYINYKDNISVIANEAPSGKELIGWNVTGVAYTPQKTSPLLFSMPANTVSVESKYAPKAPTPVINITTFTADKITIQALSETNQYGDAEYSIDGTNWQKSNTFTGLEADTTYIVRARYLGNDNYAESDAGSKEVKTKKWAEEITEPTGLTATYGQKLGDISFEVSGWSWKEPATVVSMNESEYMAQFAPADTAEYDYSNLKGYRLDADTVYIDRKLSVEVSKATPTIAWGATSQSATYTGTEIATGKLTAPTVTLVNSEMYSGEIYYSYRVQGSSDAFTSGLPTAIGTYEVKASIAADGNYMAAETASTLTLTIDWLQTDAAAVLTNQNNLLLSSNDWWAQSVTFKALDGFTISNSVDGTYESSFDYDEQTGADGTAVTYYLKNSYGEIAQKTAMVRIDKTAPTWPENGGIRVKENWWKKLVNTISFDLFYKDATVDVKVCAKDNLSGIDAYYYYVDTTGSTTVLSYDVLDTRNFTKVDGFGAQTLISLASENKYVVYAYAVDNAGNRSDYVCSDGVVLDRTSPTIGGVTTPSKEELTLTDIGAKISFTGSEAGNCFYMVRKSGETAPVSIDGFATSSENSQGMTVWTAKEGVSSVEMTTEAKQITLSSLDPNTRYTLYLAAVDKAGNSTTTTVYSKTFTTCKTMPTITTNPSISGTYGQKVEDMILIGGVAKVGSDVITGTWAVTDSNKANVPTVGTTDTYQVTFTPDASYNDIYDTVIVPVKPTVSKRAITVAADDKTKIYGQDNPELTFKIKEGTLASGDNNTALGITLTCAANESSPVKAGGYAITGTSNSANYQVTVIPGVLTITKATPTITATASYSRTYGDIKFFLNAVYDSAEASLQYAVTESKDPSNTEVENDVIVSVDARGYVTIKGAGSATITASLPETANYNAVSKYITITVNKAANAPNMPGTSINASNRCNTVGDVPLPSGWVWQESYRDKELTTTVSRPEGIPVETEVLATAEYIGADKANYINTTVTVSITRSACDHIAGDILYTDTGNGEKAPTCTEDGKGHIECRICKETIESGIVVKAAHKFSSAWTIDVPATTTSEGSKSHHCSVCGEKNDVTVIPKLVISGGGDSGNAGDSSDNDGDNNDSGNAGSITDLGIGNITKPTIKPIVIPGSFTQEINLSPGIGNNIKPATNTEDNIEEPFIKGENGKEGWDVIRAEVNQVNDGDTVTVDMNGAAVVPSDVLSEIKGKDITIVFDMGNGITWSVNGQSITGDAIGDIDFSVTTNTNSIPVDIINNITGERYSKQISLSYDGEFGFTAVLSINMEAENAGLFANLFYYNENTGEMEFICYDEIAADGTAELTFTHASDYAIVIDKEPMDGVSDGEVVNGETDSDEEIYTIEKDKKDTQNVTDAKNDAGTPWWIIIIYIVVILIGLGAFIVIKKKKSENLIN